jgi:hypothetical protein
MRRCDVVIAALVENRAPVVVSQTKVENMKPGSANTGCIDMAVLKPELTREVYVCKIWCDHYCVFL